MTRRFTWANEEGEPWKDVLRASARREFEALREEHDSVKVGQFLLTWRDAVQRIHEKVNKAEMDMRHHIDETRTDRM